MHLPPFHPPRARSTCALVVELRRVPRFPRAIHPPYIAASTKGGFFRGFRLGGNRVIRSPPLPVSLEFEEPVVVCRFSFWTMDVRGNTFFFFNFRFRRRFRRLIKKERENLARRFDEFFQRRVVVPCDFF